MIGGRTTRLTLHRSDNPLRIIPTASLQWSYRRKLVTAGIGKAAYRGGA